MKKLLLSAVVLSCIGLNAQVGINTEEGQIAGDAVFHVKNKTSEKKGVILPEVALDSRVDILNSGSGNSDGLMVWNNGEGELKDKGYYYWKKDKWVKVGNDPGPVYQKVRVFRGDTFEASDFKDSDYLLAFTKVDKVTMPNAADNKNRTLCIRNSTPAPFGTEAKQVVVSNVVNAFTINANLTRCYTSFLDERDSNWKWISTSF